MLRIVWRVFLVAALVAGSLGTVAAGRGNGGPPDLGPAIAAQERHTGRLLENPNVVGSGVGLGADGQPVIRLFTLMSGAADLPGKLDGIPVEVVVTGRFTALSHPDDTARFRPAHTGNSVGHPDITAGTIGAPCIRVFVAKEIPALLRELPASLEGYPVEVVETGEFRAF